VIIGATPKAVFALGVRHWTAREYGFGSGLERGILKQGTPKPNNGLGVAPTVWVQSPCQNVFAPAIMTVESGVARGVAGAGRAGAKRFFGHKFRLGREMPRGGDFAGFLSRG
jgi:hypothetical protein